MMANRIRPKQFKIMLTEKEKERIVENAKCLGFDNVGAYARKMMLDGYIINLKSADDKDLKHLMSEVSRIGNNINQIAKGLNSTHRIYESDIKEIQSGQATMIALLRELVRNTNEIKKM